jgi:hypothetical protein
MERATNRRSGEMGTVERGKVTRDQLYEELDRLTRDALGMSADDFIARYQRGEVDPASVIEARLAAVVRLLHEDRQWAARTNGNGRGSQTALPHS